MKQINVIMKSLLILFLISGCSVSEDKKQAEQLSSKLFASIKKGDFKKAMKFYSKDFFKQTSRAEWTSILKNLKYKLGSLQSYELVTWRVSKQAHTSGTGTFISLRYKVIYKKYKATEDLAIFKPIGGSPLIVGHNINSKGLLVE